MVIMVTDIIGASGVRMPNRHMPWLKEVRNPHPHRMQQPHQMPMPQPGITYITDMVTDYTDITDILIMDITDIIMARGVPNIPWLEEVRNPHPHLMPHPNQMLMPQPGITDITDMATYTATDITDILIMDITDITGEKDKKFEIFCEKKIFSQRQHTKKKIKQYGPHRISTTKFKICSRC